MFDCHIHTEFSTDSKMTIDQAVKSSKDKEIGMILTEHMDINFPVEGQFIFDVKEYLNKYDNYRSNSLLLGIEIGMKLDCVEQANAIVKENDFDQVIGSIHLVNEADLFYENFYKNRNKKEIYNEYLNAILDNLKKFDFIDSLGHIDYICRYAKLQDKELKYNEFSNIIDKILLEIINKDKAIELNTRRFDNKDSVINLTEIYRRYHELGGRIITIGSDAHRMEDIGKNLKDAYKLAEDLELKPVYFLNRKPEYVVNR